MAEENNEAYKESVDLAKQQLSVLKQQADTVKKIAGETDIYNALLTQISVLKKAISKSEKEQVDISKNLVKQNRQLVKATKDYIKPIKERNDLAERYKDQLKDSLGLNSEIFKMIKKGAVAALGFMILTKIVGFLSDMVGSTIELSHEMGISAGQAVIFQTNILAAKASVDGMLFSMEDLTASAKAMSAATGKIDIPRETITNVTELTKLLGDAGAAVSLERSLKTAGINSKELVANVTDMAGELGMGAGPAMEFLASNQLELQGMSEKQVLTRAREGLLMKQMGVDMQKMKQLASESLDIESSMRNEMKLRMITGKQINLNELRAAQASGDAFAVAQAQQNLVATLGSDLENNLQVQRLISQATGMEAQDLINMKNSQSEMNAEKVKEKDAQQQVNEKILEGFETISNIATMIKDGLVGGLNAVKSVVDFLMTPFKFIYDTIMASNVGLTTFLTTLGIISVVKNKQLIADTAMLAVEKGKQVFQSASLVKETALQALKSKTLLSDIGGMAMTAFKSAAAVPVIGPVLGAAAAATAAALGYSYFSKAGDVMSPADGKTRISTKEGGLLELSKNDDVVAAPGLLGGGSGGMNLSALISEIKGLRRDIQSQPIMINVDGKVVSAISRVQKRQNSTSTAGYGR
jgi:hypothetical protein